MKQAARSALAAQLVSKLVDEHGAGFKHSLRAAMADTGAERVRVLDDDGTDLGAVSMSSGRVAAKVTDPAAFLAWVADRYPSELVQAVRESFTRKVLDHAVAVGDPVDAGTGEVIPGVEISTGESFLTVRPTAEARVRMRETLRASGLLSLSAGAE
ncbi:hypothetical protein AB0F72_09395 [Actinoplanes sp. NPDC023936]|uniref:hypothetical protein n=1 Tax=Actinoplanes sp. NPDC023936 TaxID=3154910 RepID=UPI0033D3B430